MLGEKRRIFRALHESGCFVLPNPWDVGSARYLASLGFKALATTSAGAAWSLGLCRRRGAAGGHARPYQRNRRGERSAGQCRLSCRLAVEPEGVAENVQRCVATGVAGLSIEDATGEARAPLFDPELAVERIAAARAAIDASGERHAAGGAGGMLSHRPSTPLEEAIRRLTAFAEAGADCLYAPGADDGRRHRRDRHGGRAKAGQRSGAQSRRT